jgi:hypothetical protein
MGLNTLTNRSAGQTILDTFFNDIHQAMNGDLVGRNASGVPTSGQNLGTVALPWGTIRAGAIVVNGATVDASQLTSPQNRVTSGKKRSTSNQPAFITPNGAAASFILAGATTNLVLDVNGASVSVTTDITKSSLTLAPSSQNTATVNDAAAASQEDTRYWGEYGNVKPITIASAGTNITALVGKWAAFKIAGSATEYFIAFVESSTKLSKAMRGYFYDSTLAPINRTKFANTNTITLMSLGWVFVENNATTVDVTYTNPVWDFTAPTSPLTGDYWYDLANRTWKRYDGASWQIINRTFVGQVIIDTANCVGARCADFYANYRTDNTVQVEVQTTEIARGIRRNSRINVAGQSIEFNGSLPIWNMTTSLAGSADMYNAAEQASTTYYLYVKDTGDEVISDIKPYWREDLFGWYHPHNPWRQVASASNDASSNLISADSTLQQSPTVTRLTTGSGTYFPPPGAKYLRVIMVGGGGGGGGGGGSGGAAGVDGGATTFGTSLLTANGGIKGAFAGAGGAGGSATVASPAIAVISMQGSSGGGGLGIALAAAWGFGYWPGGASPFGGASQSSTAAIANTGSGGAGGPASSNGSGTYATVGGSGGAGGYIDAFIPSLAASYAYAVGAGGTGGAGGTINGIAGTAGGSGVIIVEEFYQ